MSEEASDCFHQQDGERLSRVEYAYRKIKNDIRKNNYPAGFQILEPELARVLGISRTPVREALIRLEADNLIQLVPRRGMRVLPIFQQDVSELIQALTSIQLSAARIVCGDLRSISFTALENKIRLLHNASSTSNKSEWLEVDEKFQSEFVSLTHNSRMRDVLLGLLAQLHRAKFLAFDFIENWDEFIAANSELLLALKERKEEAAVSAILRYRDAFVILFERAKEKYEHLEF